VYASDARQAAWPASVSVGSRSRRWPRVVGKAAERANKALVEAGMPTIGDGITNHKSAAYVR